ncbi:MAG: hypothetical protein NTV24_03490, partial [Candidatus Woesebacteria bacterium]|nr:hypothetical protein [Candidatus Woesebacteria bacterium]
MAEVDDLRVSNDLYRAKNTVYRRLLGKLGYDIPLSGMTASQVDNYALQHNILNTDPDDRLIGIPQHISYTVKVNKPVDFINLNIVSGGWSKVPFSNLETDGVLEEFKKSKEESEMFLNDLVKDKSGKIITAEEYYDKH